MSRTVTPPQTQSAVPPLRIPHELIAKRAYEKWCQRGMQHGRDMQDWMEAEAELRLEYSRTGSSARR